MTARGPAHVRRLALILALLDMSAVVESRHLQAARRLWDYCQESAEYIFSGITRDQHKIVNFVETRQSVTAAQVREELFHRHQKASWVQAQLSELVRRGKLAQSGERFLLKQRAA
jgi:predicted HTH transcriptional regulator